jgi:hypothetical protein
MKVADLLSSVQRRMAIRKEGGKEEQGKARQGKKKAKN